MIPELERIGFTRNEALVYWAAVRSGASSVQQLAADSGLNRITVHSIVEKFERLQVFLRTYSGKRRRIVAVDPHRLEQLIKTEELALKQKSEALHQVLPLLIRQYQQSQRGMKVSTFKGERGFEEMCEDVLRENAPMLEYANIDALTTAIGPYIAHDYLPRKHKQRVPTQFLFLDTPGARAYIQKNYMHQKAAPMEVKFILRSEFPIDTMFVIYADKLSILAPSTLDGVIIQDRLIADAMRPFFLTVWKHAGPLLSNSGKQSE